MKKYLISFFNILIIIYILSPLFSCEKKEINIVGNWYSIVEINDLKYYKEIYIDSNTYYYYDDDFKLGYPWTYNINSKNELTFLKKDIVIHKNVRILFDNMNNFKLIFNDSISRTFTKLKDKEKNKLNDYINGKIDEQTFFTSFYQRKNKYCAED